ncbi:MAG TPA: FlxA-like family protein [Novosphingobium sp.]|jgi:hypothetical protein|nr:FlxA-like family protein [Novosphingobium sp.]
MGNIRDLARPRLVLPKLSAIRVRPVSRVSFSLTDTNAFEKAAGYGVKWLASKAGGELPAEAFDLGSFDTRSQQGLHPCHAVRFDDHSGSIWVARIDEPGSNPAAGELWSTEMFVERPLGGVVRFGVQLTARRSSSAPDLHPSRPNLVTRLLETLSAEADGEALSERTTWLDRPDDADMLANLIYKPGRRLPIVAVSVDERGGAQVDLNQLARRMSGAAHIFALKPETCWELSRLIGKRMSTFQGAARIYMPGLNEDDEDPYQHPLWLPPRSGQNRGLIHEIAERVFPLGFHDRDGETRFRHIGQLRKAASAALALQNVGTEDEQSKAQISALRDEVADLKEQLDVAEGLERIASAAEKAAQQDVQRLQDEIARLKAENYRLRTIQNPASEAAEPVVDRPLESYDDLEAWAEDVLGPNIFIHSRAIRECRKVGHPAMLERITATLLAIRDHWIPYKLQGGLDRKNKADKALLALGVIDTGCFTRRERAAEEREYSVTEGKIRWVLYDHFKYGKSRDNSEQFRIYYAWDDEAQRLIIGKMPSHLQNDKS